MWEEFHSLIGLSPNLRVASPGWDIAPVFWVFSLNFVVFYTGIYIVYFCSSGEF
jgi:hypothetical protein